MKRNYVDIIQNASPTFDKRKMIGSLGTEFRGFNLELVNFGKEREKIVGINIIQEALKKEDLKVTEEKRKALTEAATKFSQQRDDLDQIGPELSEMFFRWNE
jgi:hypothetical protein